MQTPNACSPRAQLGTAPRSECGDLIDGFRAKGEAILATRVLVGNHFVIVVLVIIELYVARTEVWQNLMRDELERVCDWAKKQIGMGSEAPASWDQYVKLIESADAILHEIAVVANLAEIAPPPKGQGQHWNRGYSRLH